jgi:hypothetical protein
VAIDLPAANAAGRLVTEPSLVPPLDGDKFTVAKTTMVPRLDSLEPSSATSGESPDLVMYCKGEWPPDVGIYWNGEAEPVRVWGDMIGTGVRMSTLNFQPGENDVQLRSANGNSAVLKFTIEAAGTPPPPPEPEPEPEPDE